LAGGDEVLDLAPGVYAGVDHDGGWSMVRKQGLEGGRKKERGER
jgi:hypothetical protein